MSSSILKCCNWMRKYYKSIINSYPMLMLQPKQIAHDRSTVKCSITMKKTRV